MNKPNINEQLTQEMQPWVEYLIENYKNPNKVNSCLDVTSDNIRILEALIHNAQVYLKTFNLFKKTVIKENNLHEGQDVNYSDDQDSYDFGM